jgi:hypothetical protein
VEHRFLTCLVFALSCSAIAKAGNPTIPISVDLKAKIDLEYPAIFKRYNDFAQNYQESYELVTSAIKPSGNTNDAALFRPRNESIQTTRCISLFSIYRKIRDSDNGKAKVQVVQIDNDRYSAEVQSKGESSNFILTKILMSPPNEKRYSMSSQPMFMMGCTESIGIIHASTIDKSYQLDSIGCAEKSDQIIVKINYPFPGSNVRMTSTMWLEPSQEFRPTKIVKESPTYIVTHTFGDYRKIHDLWIPMQMQSANMYKVKSVPNFTISVAMRSIASGISSPESYSLSNYNIPEPILESNSSQQFPSRFGTLTSYLFGVVFALIIVALIFRYLRSKRIQHRLS